MQACEPLLEEEGTEEAGVEGPGPSTAEELSPLGVAVGGDPNTRTIWFLDSGEA